MRWTVPQKTWHRRFALLPFKLGDQWVWLEWFWSAWHAEGILVDLGPEDPDLRPVINPYHPSDTREGEWPSGQKPTSPEPLPPPPTSCEREGER